MGKRLLFNDIQSKRDNRRDGFWLARMNLATHFDRSKTVGFYVFWVDFPKVPPPSPPGLAWGCVQRDCQVEKYGKQRNRSNGTYHRKITIFLKKTSHNV